MKLGFIILAHSHPAAIRRLTDILATDGDTVVVHFDSSASKADQQAVAQLATERPEQIQVLSKVHCVWGEWSLVEAVLLALRAFATMPNPPDFIHLMSGADFPMRPISQFKEFLARNPHRDFIECFDISQKSWVKGGLSLERFLFYFPFNFKTHRKAFDRVVRWHRKLKIKRRMPLRLKPRMGSQWWTLRWSTCEKVMKYTSDHPEVPKYFKSTWIPDESYFQTIVGNIIPKSEVVNLQMMFHHLTPSGRPYVFYNDHLPVLRRLPHFFIRKVSPEASVLWENIYKSDGRPHRVPTLKFLVKARDLARRKIDQNHTFTTSVPGHLDAWYGPELRAEKRPIILLLLTNDTHLSDLEELTRQNPAFCWLGRPFAPKALRMPSDTLARMGMSRETWEVRDFFKQQFIHYLHLSTPASQIPVAAILPIEDQPDWLALNLLEGVLPIMMTGLSENPQILSRIYSTLQLSSIRLLRKMVNVDFDHLSQVFDKIREHPQAWLEREIRAQYIRDSLLPNDPETSHDSEACAVPTRHEPIHRSGA